MPVERWTDEMLDQLAETSREAAQITRENAEAIRQMREESRISREELKANFETTQKIVDENASAIQKLREESKEQGIRFAAYQQASQWVANLAFGLLATATITTIVTTVLRK